MADDESARAYVRLDEGAGRRHRAANAAGFLAAGVFLAAALILLLAIQQGADLRQLLIGGLAVLVLNLLIALVWTAIAPRGD